MAARPWRSVGTRERCLGDKGARETGWGQDAVGMEGVSTTLRIVVNSVSVWKMGGGSGSRPGHGRRRGKRAVKPTVHSGSGIVGH